MIKQLMEIGGSDDDPLSSGLNDAEEEASLKLRCIGEFKAYLEMSKVYVNDKSKNKCPLGWWKHHWHSFKLLAPVARKWLGCLSSSVPSERAFSSSGNTVTAR